MTHQKTATDYPVMRFERQDDWAAWLEEHHATAPGIWLQLAKKASGAASVSYAEALEVALCYGWIDGQKRSYDEGSWLQKFTPRGADLLPPPRMTSRPGIVARLHLVSLV